jgi:hypothetical protein
VYESYQAVEFNDKKLSIYKDDNNQSIYKTKLNGNVILKIKR